MPMRFNEDGTLGPSEDEKDHEPEVVETPNGTFTVCARCGMVLSGEGQQPSE